MPVKRCRLLSEMLSLKQHLDFRSLLASRTICSHSLFPTTPAPDSMWVARGPEEGMATVPSPGQGLALPPSLTWVHRQPWADLTALAYPREDFVAEYKVALKATGRSPRDLLSPSAFRDSEFPSENGQTAPQTVGHDSPPFHSAAVAQEQTNGFGNAISHPLQIKSSKPRLGTQRSLSAMRSLGKMNQMSHFQNIKIVYKSSQFLFSFE